MPVYPCHHPTCAALVGRRGEACAAHAAAARRGRADRHRHYDRHHRDRAAKRFYDSAVWARARAAKLAADPTCQRCEREFATVAHHLIPLASCVTDAQRLGRKNLQSLCPGCHSIVEREIAAAAAGDGGPTTP